MHAHPDVTGCVSKPAGEWRPHTLTWRVALIKPGPPLLLSAEFATAAGSSKADRVAQPVHAAFVCEDRCITGVTARVEDGAPVGEVTRRFVSGKYMVGPAASQGTPQQRGEGGRPAKGGQTPSA